MENLRSFLFQDGHSRGAFVLLLLTMPFIFLSGCKTENTITGTGSNGNLIDPFVMPRVVATFPVDGSTGPFGSFATHQDYRKPHFIIEFNKVINTLAFQSNWISVQGFDRPVMVIPLRAYYYYPLLQKSSQSADDVITSVVGFNIYDSLGDRGLMQYHIGKKYTVTVNTSFEDFNENHFLQPYQFSFTPEPYFRFVSSSPHDGTQDVRPLSTVSISFNSRIDTSIFATLQLFPSISGHWTIESDSSSASFQHPQQLPYNTSIVASVNASARDIDGNQIHAPESFAFRTSSFEVTGTSPSLLSQYPLRLTQSVTIYFSGSIDMGTVSGAFKISPDIGIVLQSYFGGFTFSPSVEYAPNTTYLVSLSTALTASDGTPLASTFSVSFTTDRFRVDAASPLDGSDFVYRGASIYVYFTSVIDTGSVRGAFSITPNIAGTLNLNPSDGFVFRPYTQFAADTTYTVRISGALRSKSGYTLGSPYTFSFRTGH